MTRRVGRLFADLLSPLASRAVWQVATAAVLAVASIHCSGNDASDVPSSDVPRDQSEEAGSASRSGPVGLSGAAPKLPRCGDGRRDIGEACDDGNAVSGDGCSATCHEIEYGFGCPRAGAACTRFDAATWMGAVDDRTNLAELSVPGTHDSCARREPVPGTAKCQELSLADQLSSGVRYLDIRCRHVDNGFAIHHGVVFQQMAFDDVLEATFTFLKIHPSETVLMSVKEEYEPSGNSRTFEQTFDAYVNKNPAAWSLGSTIPSLSDARGKIVLLRRFGASGAKGLDATPWEDRATFTIEGPARLRVQDAYEVPDNQAKWMAITSLLTEAGASDSRTLFLNYTSGYKSRLFGIPNIPAVSDTINPSLESYLSALAGGRIGVLAMDFVDAERANLVLRNNFR